MTQVNLFANDPGNPPQVPQDLLTELVGENKKFKSVEELAKGKYESDQFIERLQGELAGLREELNTRQNLSTLVDKLSVPSETSQKPNESNGNTGENTQAFKPEDIDRIIDQRLQEKDAERIQNENLRTVRDTLSQTLGPDFPNRLESISAATGMSKEDMTDMAKLRPKAFLTLVQAAVQQTSNSSSQGATGLFTPPANQQFNSFKPVSSERTKSYYDKLKTDNVKNYWSPAVQNQMHQDAIRLGESFFDS